MPDLYHKIAGPYKRDPDNLRSLTPEFVNPVVKMLSWSEIWLATEKLDGMNMRIIWDGHRITYGGRTDNADIPAELVNWLDSKVQIPGAEEWFEENFGETEVILFGEGVGPGIQKNGAVYGDHKHFVGFDVAVNGKYLSYDNARSIFTRIGLPSVKLTVENWTLMDIIDGVKHDYIFDEPSRLYGPSNDYKPEGVVAIPAEPLYDQRGNRVVVKIKKVDFHV